MTRLRILALGPAGDSVLAAALAALGAFELLTNADASRYGRGGLAYALLLATTAPIALRRRLPLGAAVAIAVPAFLQAILDQSSGFGSYFAILIAAYSAGAHGSPTRGLAAGLVIGLAVSAHLMVPGSPPDAGAYIFTYLPLTAATIAGIGQNRRLKRTSELTLRVAEAETEARERELRAAAEERARIARELHDVVAHSLSVIVLQAVGAQRLPRNHGGRDQALTAIESAGRQGLAEMRRALDVMRAAQPDSDSLEPQPGLEQLPALLIKVREAGLGVTVRREGEPRELPAGVELSAYRIVQEALTNVLKHAPGASAEVNIRYRDGPLVLEISNDRPRLPVVAPPEGSRAGLIGMRERVALFGGELEAGPTAAGGFRVVATLPAGPGAG